jgi:hypothetical protein
LAGFSSFTDTVVSSGTAGRMMVQIVVRQVRSRHVVNGQAVPPAVSRISPESPNSGARVLASAGRLRNLLLVDEVTNNKLRKKVIPEKVTLFRVVTVPPPHWTILSALANRHQ